MLIYSVFGSALLLIVLMPTSDHLMAATAEAAELLYLADMIGSHDVFKKKIYGELDSCKYCTSRIIFRAANWAVVLFGSFGFTTVTYPLLKGFCWTWRA